MTDMTCEQYRELADLCGPTAKALNRIAEGYGDDADRGDITDCFRTAVGFLGVVKGSFSRSAQEAKEREDAERQLREDIAAMSKAGEGHVDVDAIIRRVREADKG